MTPQKILLYYDGKGYAGAEVHLTLLTRHIDRRRYEPVVIVPGRLWSGFSSELADNLRASSVPVYPTPEGTGSPIARLFGIWRTVNMLRSLNSTLAYVGTSTAIGLRMDILTLRLAGMRVVRLLHLPASRMAEFRDDRETARNVRLLDRLVWRDVTVSEADRRELVDNFAIPHSKIEVCYHGLEFEGQLNRHSSEAARRALGLDPTLRAVGLVGRFDEQKGHRFLVEAAPAILQQAGPLQFILVGSGPLQREIETLVEQKGLRDHFVFAGFQRDVPSWIKAFDLAVMPSLYESAGLVLLECLAQECPVVASDLPCFREHVGDNACSFVPAGNAGALAEAVIADLRNPEGSRMVAQRAAALVRERFDIKRHVSQLMQIFDSALASRR